MAATATSVEQEILELEHRYWEAAKRSDSRELSSLTAASFTFVMKDGIIKSSRDELVGMLTGEDFKLKSYKIDSAGTVFRQLGPEAAVVAYPAHWDYEREGKADSIKTFNSSTWVKEGGSWKCAIVTESRAG
jgi:hypothetical protein